MSDRIEIPNVVIKPGDQSAPKEHWADREIKKAAEEIDGGRYIETPTEENQAFDNMGLALGAGTYEGIATGRQPTLEDFQETRDSAQLARHPRVMEALEKMQKELEETKGHQLVEKNAALRELIIASEAKNRWDGQGRWMGHENQEARQGQILTPQAFYDRLGKVVGKGKIKLSEHIMFPEGAKSGLGGLFMKNPKWTGATKIFVETKEYQARQLETEARQLQTQARKLRAAGQNAEADKAFYRCADMVQAATELLLEAGAHVQLAEPEYLRIGTIQWPLATEWMIVQFTEWGTVWKPKHYGWRTTLLTMIRCGAITEVQAHKAFPVKAGPAAEWYLEQLYDFKLNRGTVQ
jgi:hypothetical protein